MTADDRRLGGLPAGSAETLSEETLSEETLSEETLSAETLSAVLVIEDGHEYITNLQRFLGQEFCFVRAADGQAALELLHQRSFSCVFLDMCFDRAATLVGDLSALTERFSGDEDCARRFLEDNQGTYILAALREAGHRLPVVFSYDFDGQPRRLHNLQSRYGPLSYLDDTAGTVQIASALRAAAAPPA